MELFFCNRIPSVKQRKVGIMGSQTKESAFACLENCPLLEDMGEWTHWDLVFKPELGSLKDFVQRYGGTRIHTISGKYCTHLSAIVLSLNTITYNMQVSHVSNISMYDVKLLQSTNRTHWQSDDDHKFPSSGDQSRKIAEDNC